MSDDSNVEALQTRLVAFVRAFGCSRPTARPVAS
jgi:hypothetical protein